MNKIIVKHKPATFTITADSSAPSKNHKGEHKATLVEQQLAAVCYF
jgi:hypothetical protein